MRKTTEYNTENRLTVDIEGLMAMLSCGAVTARKIADCAEAKIIVGRRVLYNVDKIKKYLDAMDENRRKQRISFGMRVQRKISVFQEFTLGNPKILC